jgi:hypothetical protein
VVEVTSKQLIPGPVENQDDGARWRTYCDNTLPELAARRDKCECYVERAAPKVEFEATDVRVLCAREISKRFLSEAKLLKGMVARDGIEPPMPAFSGPLTDSPKWFEINGCQ